MGHAHITQQHLLNALFKTKYLLAVQKWPGTARASKEDQAQALSGPGGLPQTDWWLSVKLCAPASCAQQSRRQLLSVTAELQCLTPYTDA